MALGNPNILLTGRPGVGKTTALIRIAELVARRSPVGFYTEEVRVGGRRRGFKIVTLDGREGVLAHVDLRSRHRVGKYGVDVEGFEQLVCPILERAGAEGDIVLVDEIGKMECFSRRFREAVERLADGPAALVATIAARGGGLIAAMRKRPNVQLFTLSRENRDAMPHTIAALLGD